MRSKFWHVEFFIISFHEPVKKQHNFRNRGVTDRHQYLRLWGLHTTSHIYPSKYFISIQVILYGDTVKCSKLDINIFITTIQVIWNIMPTPFSPFHIFHVLPPSTSSSMWSEETWGVGEIKTQVSSSLNCVHPWQLLPANAISHTGGD